MNVNIPTKLAYQRSSIISSVLNQWKENKSK